MNRRIIDNVFTGLIVLFVVALVKFVFFPGLSDKDVREITNEEFDKRYSQQVINTIVERSVTQKWKRLVEEAPTIFGPIVDSIWQERIAPRVVGQPVTVDGNVVWESIPYNDTLIGSQIYCDSLRPRSTDSINLEGIGLGEQYTTNDSLELRVILDFPKPQGAVFPILGAGVFPKGRIPRGRSLSTKTMTLFKYDGKYNKLRVVTPDKPGMYDLAVFYVEIYDYDCKTYVKIVKIEVVE